MIKKSQKIKIKKVLGNHYSKPILSYLNDNNIMNKYGLPYTSSSIINNVMNGESNPEIEKAIFKVVELKKQELLSEKANQKRILT